MPVRFLVGSILAPVIFFPIGSILTIPQAAYSINFIIYLVPALLTAVMVGGLVGKYSGLAVALGLVVVVGLLGPLSNVDSFRLSRAGVIMLHVGVGAGFAEWWGRRRDRRKTETQAA